MSYAEKKILDLHLYHMALITFQKWTMFFSHGGIAAVDLARG